MKHIKSLLAILLLAALLLSGCGAAGKAGYATTVAATYGDRTIYLDEANFWLRVGELSYSYYVSLYTQMYGTDFWTAESGRRTQTFAESLKEDVMAEFRQIGILLDHESEYDTTLTEADLKKIDDTVAEMKTSYGTQLFSESVIGSFNDEALKQSLITRTKALKVWEGVRNQAATTVTDEECKSFTVRYFRVNDSGSVKDGDNTITGKAVIDLLEKSMQEGKSFTDLTSTYSSLYHATESFRLQDTETTTELFKIGKEMKDGQVRQFTDSSGTSPIYYLVECVSADDPYAAINARQELESEQKEDHFETVLAEWQKAAKAFSVKGAFTSLPLPSGN